MNNIEELLNKEKERMDNLIVPNEMEDRLRSSLNNIPNKKRKRNFKIKVASIILAFLVLSYNADTLAFYGKKLIGYENVMNGTLQELNNLGKGQLINKSHTFSNGVKISVDGIMLDDNNMVIFYTIYSPNGNVMDISNDIHIRITGIGNRLFTYGGQGHANEDDTELKWVISTHQVPMFFEKTINFYVELNKDIPEDGTIEFKIDRTQALGKGIKIPINKKVELDQRNITIQTLTASPTTTVVKGQIQDIFELGLDYINKDRFRPEKLEMALIVNGEEIARQGAGMSTSMKGTNFEITYDALPKDIKDLQLKLIAFGGDHDTNEVIKLEKGETKQLKILDQDISIEKIYEKDGNTYITFTTEENIALSRVYLNIDGEKKELQETIPEDYEKIDVNDEPIINYTRTMKFIGTGDNLELEINRIRFTKSYDKVIYSY